MFGAGYTITNTGLFNGLATQHSVNKFIYFVYTEILNGGAQCKFCSLVSNYACLPQAGLVPCETRGRQWDNLQILTTT